MKNTIRTISVFLLLFASTALAQGEEVVEKHPNGKKKAVYRVNSEGQIHGSYMAYYENGAKRFRIHYSKGKMDGLFEAWFKAGKRWGRRVYKKGVVQTTKTWNEDGVLVHEIDKKKGKRVLKVKDHKDVILFPRTMEEIKRAIIKIDPPKDRIFKPDFDVKPVLKGEMTAGVVKSKIIDNAMRRANVYRYLCGVKPDVRSKPEFNSLAQHAALVCALNGDISHTPPRPAGLDDGLFHLGYKGASESNLHRGQSGLRHAIDGFMDDSDPSNIDAVGHRRWIIAPSQKYAGLGTVKGTVAMHVHDSSRKGKRPLTMAYPGPGYFPIEYIAGPHVAWHFSWDPTRIRQDPDRPNTIRCYLLDSGLDIVRDLEIRDISLHGESVGEYPALIFRPVIPPQYWKPGLRILVKYDALRMPKKTSPFYIVEFFQSEEKSKQAAPPRRR